jgi:hypothetical protein
MLLVLTLGLCCFVLVSVCSLSLLPEVKPPSVSVPDKVWMSESSVRHIVWAQAVPDTATAAPQRRPSGLLQQHKLVSGYYILH